MIILNRIVTALKRLAKGNSGLVLFVWGVESGEEILRQAQNDMDCLFSLRTGNYLYTVESYSSGKRVA
jgi:hypothetical protein